MSAPPEPLTPATTASIVSNMVVMYTSKLYQRDPAPAASRNAFTYKFAADFADSVSADYDTLQEEWGTLEKAAATLLEDSPQTPETQMIRQHIGLALILWYRSYKRLFRERLHRPDLIWLDKFPHIEQKIHSLRNVHTVSGARFKRLYLQGCSLWAGTPDTGYEDVYGDRVAAAGPVVPLTPQPGARTSRMQRVLRADTRMPDMEMAKLLVLAWVEEAKARQPLEDIETENFCRDVAAAIEVFSERLWSVWETLEAEMRTGQQQRSGHVLTAAEVETQERAKRAYDVVGTDIEMLREQKELLLRRAAESRTARELEALD